MNKTAIVLVASGNSRRFGRRDKMLANLGGASLIEHAARTVSTLHPLARVAVCPANRPEIGESLIDRFVVAVNKKPRQGLGHSISVGAQIALQFKPDAIMVCMGDMPFVEPWLLDAMARRLFESNCDIVHAGASARPHPPTIFGRGCFDRLAALDGDDGAKSLLRSATFRITPFAAPAPLLLDVDTREDLALATRQLAIRTRWYALRGQNRESGAGLDDEPTPAPRSRSSISTLSRTIAP